MASSYYHNQDDYSRIGKWSVFYSSYRLYPTTRGAKWYRAFESHYSPITYKNKRYPKISPVFYGVGDGIRTHEYRNHNPVP